ncbi:MAG: hypothetical protein R3Y09_06940 [Clostridia bacterium]
MKKYKKYIEFITTKIKLTFCEKRFNKNDATIKYMFTQNPKSDQLIVVSSACTKVGIKARYNYVRTLSKINANKLFILDDFGYDNRGAYYLGYNCGDEVYNASIGLIKTIKEKHNIQKIIFFGTSKGGFALLNFMFSFPDSDCIIGAPQYKLGNYLLAPALKETQQYIMKDNTKANVDYLNNILKDKIEKCKDKSHKVYLHYSNREHTYEEHIKYLIEDLNSNGFEVLEDCNSYENHWDVSYYYPSFLLENLSKYYSSK